MTTETLKKLIEVEFDRSETISQFKSEVFRLIDLYSTEQEILLVSSPSQPWGRLEVTCEPDEVPYGEVCSCNPKNGGSGICGCVMGNKMVPNPKKSGSSWETRQKFYTTTTDSLNIKATN